MHRQSQISFYCEHERRRRFDEPSIVVSPLPASTDNNKNNLPSLIANFLTTLVFYLHISRLETSQKFKEKKSKQSVFLIFSLVSFLDGDNLCIFVMGGIDRLRLFPIITLVQ